MRFVRNITIAGTRYWGVTLNNCFVQFNLQGGLHDPMSAYLAFSIFHL